MNIANMRRMNGPPNLGEWCGGSYDPNKPNQGANSPNGPALVHMAQQGGHSTWTPGCSTCLDPSLSQQMQAACVYYDYNMTNRYNGLQQLKNSGITTTATGKPIDFTQILPKLPGGSNGGGSNTPPGPGATTTPSGGSALGPLGVFGTLAWFLLK